jgi:hypothetical protein
MATRTYSPKNIHISLTHPTLGVIHARGFANGTFVTVDRDMDAFEKKEGADGEVTRAQTNNRSGSVTFELDQASPFNDDLTNLANLDEASGTGICVFQLTDGGGNTLESSLSCWVRKKASSVFSRKSEDRKWILDLGQMIHNPGGSTIVAG